MPLARMNADLFGGKAMYWQEIVDHTTYDEFWKKRSLWRFMDGVKCAVLNVGGWFDAEDPVGPLHVYRAVEKKNPATVNQLVMGPWSHGGWGRGPGSRLGNVGFAVGSYRNDQLFVMWLALTECDLHFVHFHAQPSVSLSRIFHNK